MQVTITIIRYPKKYAYFALLAMAIHRFPLWFNKKISFFKLMGCGKNGTFDKNPDWQQWGILTVNQLPEETINSNQEKMIAELYGSFISRWFNFFNCETWTIYLKPIEGHGSWDGTNPFGKIEKAILTRATIRLTKLNAFWKNVNGVAQQMAGAEGLITSIGIGEVPFIKQATFSIWESKESMKKFAYQMHQHQEVIKKTRKENWYSEDMFVRFIPLHTSGTINGANPFRSS